jgi:hypothetical protein
MTWVAALVTTLGMATATASGAGVAGPHASQRFNLRDAVSEMPSQR